MAGRHVRDQVQMSRQGRMKVLNKTPTVREERREHVKHIREDWWAGVGGGGNKQREYSDFSGECLCLHRD